MGSLPLLLSVPSHMLVADTEYGDCSSNTIAIEHSMGSTLHNVHLKGDKGDNRYGATEKIDEMFAPLPGEVENCSFVCHAKLSYHSDRTYIVRIARG